MTNPQFRLLEEFKKLFGGRLYRHRSSNLGDWVAMHLFEDLVTMGRSVKLALAVQEKSRVLNVQNRRRGIEARRGDGTFGEIISGETPLVDDGYVVPRGPIATVEIGVEEKILAKAMIKQIDRVVNDLRNQVAQFRRGGGDPICVGIVGINKADHYVSYEGDRAFPTTGRDGFAHPCQEAADAKRRILGQAAPEFDEFLVIEFRASNEPPYHFEWVNYDATRLDYGAVLTRISRKYQERF